MRKLLKCVHWDRMKRTELGVLIAGPERTVDLGLELVVVSRGARAAGEGARAGQAS